MKQKIRKIECGHEVIILLSDKWVRDQNKKEIDLNKSTIFIFNEEKKLRIRNIMHYK